MKWPRSRTWAGFTAAGAELVRPLVRGDDRDVVTPDLG